MKSTAEAFAKVLIKRHARLCQPKRRTAKTVTALDIQDCIITYGALCKEAGAGCPTGSGTFLGEIHRQCLAHKWPPLNALAVSGRSFKPGTNYPTKEWNREIRECIAFAGYPPIQDARWE